MNPPRTVIDTNLLISALLFHNSSLAWLRDAWCSGRILPLVSKETLGELVLVLGYSRFKLTKEKQEKLLGDYEPYCKTITVPGNINVPPCRDPRDRPFLELAIAANADALITGDKDLLALADSFEVPIMKATDFRWLYAIFMGISDVG